MPVMQSPIVTVNNGEITPYIYGRLDLSKYNSSAELLQNMIAFKHGYIARRPGTYFVSEVKTSSKDTILVPFEFSTVQAYVIEFGDKYVRFYRNSGRIEVVGVPVEVVTPYLEADLRELKFTQSADILYITHPSYAPRKLSRTSHVAWTLIELDPIDGPYLEENTDAAKTLNIAAATGATTVTAVGHTPFAATDVGRIIRIKYGANNWGYCKITGFTNNTLVNVDVKFTVTGAGAATATWRLGEWSATTSYPAAVSFHQERLWFGGGTYSPQKLWASRSSAFETFSPTQVDGTIVDSNGLVYNIATDQVNSVVWFMSQTNKLVVGTKGAEFVVLAETDGVLTPDNVTVTRISRYGSADYAIPLYVASNILFLQRAGRKLRELGYEFTQDKYLAPDITLFGEHLTVSTLTGYVYEQEPEALLWITREDGLLLGFTYDKEQNVLAWHRHPVGGTDAKVKSAAVIPLDSEGRDQTWFIVERTINGTTVKYVEYLTPYFGHTTEQEDAFFVDSGLTYDGVATDTIVGLDHLEGETVSVLGDGSVFTDAVVTAGSITLASAVTKAQVGLGYTSAYKSVRLNTAIAQGYIQGRRQKLHELYVRIYRSSGFEVGTDDANIHRPPFRVPSDPMGSAPRLKTEDVQIPLKGTWEKTSQIYIRQTLPLPLNVSYIAMRHTVNE